MVEQAIEHYKSHRWHSQRQGGNPVEAESYEYVCFCDQCGCENRGDPAEFPELEYPQCANDKQSATLKELLPDMVEHRAYTKFIYSFSERDIYVDVSPAGVRQAPSIGRHECELVENWENYWFTKLPNLGLMTVTKLDEGISLGIKVPGWRWEKWRFGPTDFGVSLYWDEIEVSRAENAREENSQK